MSTSSKSSTASTIPAHPSYPLDADKTGRDHRESALTGLGPVGQEVEHGLAKVHVSNLVVTTTTMRQPVAIEEREDEMVSVRRNRAV